MLLRTRRIAGSLLVIALLVVAMPAAAAPGAGEVMISSPWDAVVSLWQHFSALFNWEASNDAVESTTQPASTDDGSGLDPLGTYTAPPPPTDQDSGGLDPYG